MSDLDIIKQIEEILNVKLEKLDEIRGISKGYTLNQNKEVKGLCLHDFRRENLKRIISPLKALTKLTELNLSYNELSDISPLKALTKLTELNLNSNALCGFFKVTLVFSQLKQVFLYNFGQKPKNNRIFGLKIVISKTRTIR